MSFSLAVEVRIDPLPQVFADPTFHDVVESALNESKPEGSTTNIVAGIVNASADSFYASQGRQTSFPDCNQTLIQQIIDATEDVATLEVVIVLHFYLKINDVIDGNTSSIPLSCLLVRKTGCGQLCTARNRSSHWRACTGSERESARRTWDRHPSRRRADDLCFPHVAGFHYSSAGSRDREMDGKGIAVFSKQ